MVYYVDKYGHFHKYCSRYIHKQTNTLSSNLEKMQESQIIAEAAKDPNNPIINIDLLEQLYDSSFEEAREKLSNLFPLHIRNFFLGLEERPLKATIKKLVGIYNSKLSPGENDEIQYDYPSSLHMRKICIDLLPDLKIEIENMPDDSEELKDIFKTAMDEMKKPFVQNVSINNYDYLVMHPFEIKAQAKEHHSLVPTYRELMNLVKEKDADLWNSIVNTAPEVVEQAYKEIKQIVESIEKCQLVSDENKEKVQKESKEEGEINSDEDGQIDKQSSQLRTEPEVPFKRSHEEMEETNFNQQNKKQTVNFADIRKQLADKMPGMREKIEAISDSQMQEIMLRHKQKRMRAKCPVHNGLLKTVDLTDPLEDPINRKKARAQNGDIITCVCYEGRASEIKHDEIIKEMEENE